MSNREAWTLNYLPPHPATARGGGGRMIQGRAGLARS